MKNLFVSLCAVLALGFAAPSAADHPRRPYVHYDGHYHGRGNNNNGWYALGGAVVGYAIAREQNRAEERRTYQYYDNGNTSMKNFFVGVCRRLPNPYAGNRAAADAWVQGCAERKMREQVELEQQAYEDGKRD